MECKNVRKLDRQRTREKKECLKKLNTATQLTQTSKAIRALDRFPNLFTMQNYCDKSTNVTHILN